MTGAAETLQFLKEEALGSSWRGAMNTGWAGFVSWAVFGCQGIIWKCKVKNSAAVQWN